MPSGTDAFRWYNVGGWADYGLAVPNVGNDPKSQNQNIRELVELIGRNLSHIMWHPDANLRTPPSINTIRRVHQLCVRGRDLLAGRAVPSNVNNLETVHAVPSWEQHLIFPVPYFKVRNTWMKSMCGYMLICLTDCIQHQENAQPIEISTRFAGIAGQYIQRVYRQMSVELLRVPRADAEKPDFTLSEEQLQAYDPAKWFTSTEMIDTVAAEFSRPTEDDLSVLTDGIPVSQLPLLPLWPAMAAAAAAQSGSTGSSVAPTASSFAPAPNP